MAAWHEKAAAAKIMAKISHHQSSSIDRKSASAAASPASSLMATRERHAM